MKTTTIPALLSLTLACIFMMNSTSAEPQRARELGVKIGVMQPGKLNAITDVPGVKVGQVTLIEGDVVRTGVTAILPHDGNLFQQKVPAAMYIGNGFGKLAGYTQVEELGTIETPIVLTNTLSVPTAADALIDYTLSQPGNENVRSVNPVVGETNDGGLNDIQGRHVTKQHVLQAIADAKSGPVTEGAVGAGTGTRCFGFKGGIGTSSRRLPDELGGWTVGVLVQTNFGGALQINGAAIGVALDEYYFREALEKQSAAAQSVQSDTSADGSCMIVVLTDAPLSDRNLNRLAKRAFMGLAKTGGIASNGSGDYVIAVSTAKELRIPYESEADVRSGAVLRNDRMSPLFMAAIEATEEAVINSLFMAQTMTGRDGYTSHALPVDKVLKILAEHNLLEK